MTTTKGGVPLKTRPLTVAQLRAAIEGMPDWMNVCVIIHQVDQDGATDVFPVGVNDVRRESPYGVVLDTAPTII